jgi:hypothetical protein
VGATQIAAGAVGTSELADSSVTTAKIAAGAVVQADIATGVAGTGPAFNARLNGTQSLTANVATKLNFSIEDFDTNNCFDTATYRFTPNVAGYYQFIVQTYGSATTGFSTARLYKNGSIEKEGVLGIPVAGVGTICSVVGLIYMNGTTDYIEAYGYQSVNTTIQGTASVTFFSGSMVRAA